MTEAPSPSPFVRCFVEAAAPILAARFAPTRCLNATRICLEVMRRFKVRARALSVNTEAFNAAFVRKFNAAGRPPTDEAEWQRWIADGAWSLGIDTNTKPDDADRNIFAGHVVAVVQDWLVDGAAAQFSRPAKGIHMPEIFVGNVTPKFLKGDEWFLFANESSDVMIRYRARPTDFSFIPTGGFQRSQHNCDAARDIYEAMRSKLKEQRTCP